MKPLAVIAGIGGINAAGRSSSHHGYRRSVIDVLEPALAADTIRSLAGLMRIEGTIDAEKRRHILEHTLVRGLEPDFLDPGNVAWNCKARLARDTPVSFFIGVACSRLPGNGRSASDRRSFASTCRGREVRFPSPARSVLPGSSDGFDPALYPAAATTKPSDRCSRQRRTQVAGHRLGHVDAARAAGRVSVYAEAR
jgi:acetoacetyl-[acyl-carrier protein] synthase